MTCGAARVRMSSTPRVDGTSSPRSSMIRRRTLDWHFCPHCETQLDAETFICPACRWDPLAVSEAVAAPAQGSLMDRYRGTEYDPGDWAPDMNTTTLTMPVSKSANRVRTIVVVAFLAVLGLYGSMLVYTNLDSGQDQPAAAIGIHR